MKTTTLAGTKPTVRQMEDFIRGKLASDDTWAAHWLVEIYRLQTTTEQATGSTSEANGVGFSSVGSEFLSSLARQQMRWRGLSDRQMESLHRILPRYWRQVVAAMGEEAVARCMEEEQDNEPALCCGAVKAVKAAKAVKKMRRQAPAFDGNLLDEFGGQEVAVQDGLRPGCTAGAANRPFLAAKAVTP